MKLIDSVGSCFSLIEVCEQGIENWVSLYHNIQSMPKSLWGHAAHSLSFISAGISKVRSITRGVLSFFHRFMLKFLIFWVVVL